MRDEISNGVPTEESRPQSAMSMPGSCDLQGCNGPRLALSDD